MTTQSYTGSCQCGAIAYRVDADLDKTFVCNCSRCKRLGSVLTFAPESAFELTRDGATTEYLFNTRTVSHRFCTVCGIEAYALGEKNGQTMVAVNVNCLDGVDPRALQSKAVDGASS